MLEIRIAGQVHGKDIADFQCKMAIQTQNLKLDRELVEEAADYLIKHKQYGQYFIAVDPSTPEKAQGSLLITYQNAQSWWIQSVYVRQQHRRKGVFTSLFKAAESKGKQKLAKSMQLYVQKQNERAMKTYQKLGMYCNGYQFCGFELVYRNSEVIKDLQSPLKQQLKIQKVQAGQNKQIDNNFVKISGKTSLLNRGLQCYIGSKLMGTCQYFYQFSDWRFGIIVYINYFSSIAQHSTVCLQSFLKYLFQNCQLKVGAIRIVAKPQEIKELKKIIPAIHQDVYYVMQIDL